MNKFNKTLYAVAICSLLGSVGNCLAEDIDIYAKPASATGAGNPNILIVIDNSANWAAANQGWPGGIKQGESELKAVRTVASELDDKVNLGMMLFTPGSGSNKNGGYVRFKVRPMNQTNKTAFADLIGYGTGCVDGPNSLNTTPNCILKNFNTSSEKTNAASTDYSAVMFEAFKYFGGYTSPAHATDNVAGSPLSASQFGPTRYAGNPDAKSDPFAYTPITDLTRTTYVPPIASTDNCAKTYVIFIGNGFPSQDSGPSLLSGVGGDTTQLPLNNLAVSTTSSTATTLLETTACGTYASVAACQTAAAAKYPTYSTSCNVNSTCSSGTTTSATTVLGTSACGTYASAAACAADIAIKYPGYSSYSCTSATACSFNTGNTIHPVVADTGCISPNLNTSTSCNSYGNATYPSYSGFTCTSLGGSGCRPGNKHWSLDATTSINSGNAYTMNGITTTTVTTTSDSHNIYGTATTTTIAATPTGSFSAPTSANINYADEWARFLNRTDVSSASGRQKVLTYTIDVYKDQQDVKETALLLSMARAGGGKYFAATNEDAIKVALRKIISEIQATDSVFASSSLPVSVNTQGTYLNQVFMGMFRPDVTSAPRWFGNLKQYKFAFFNGDLKLADKNNSEAISSTTGFITACAASFWGTDTGAYWDFPDSQALGTCTAYPSAFPSSASSPLFSDYPDGEVVEKGGAAQHLRGVLSSGSTLTSSSQLYAVCSGSLVPGVSCRKLLTCDGSSTTSCAALTSFDDANTAITTTNLNLPVATATERTNTINWIRGQDIYNENANFDASGVAISNEVRPSVHGGVVHGQPAVVDYGGSTGVVAFYGADDGVFHAVNANQLDTDGSELWGFIAPETYSRFYRLRDNGVTTPLISFPADPVSAEPAGTARKDYFFDGSVGIYQKSATVWLYTGMRRGGRAIYAFDASTPSSPVLKWRKGCFTNSTTNDTSCSTDANFPTAWSGIGQTWSKATIGYLSGYVDGSSNPKPVLIFGGGYDTCEDNDSQAPCTGTRKGSQVWFVDADTGNIIRTYPVNASVPGDLTLLTDSAGNVTYVYAVDLSGRVYRINVGTYDGATFTGWTSNAGTSTSLIANLSETGNARKFINGPDVVEDKDFNAVLVGSGDREHPLINSYACNNFATSPAGTFVTNQFYMVKDIPSAYPVNPTVAGDLTDVTTPSSTINAFGWKFNFAPCEQSVNKSLTIAGTTYFGTNTPTTATGSSCSANLGVANGYAVSYLNGNASTGTSRFALYLGGGMPPSPVGGVVDVNGVRVPFLIGGIDTAAADGSAFQVTKPKIDPKSKRYRSYWYIQNN